MIKRSFRLFAASALVFTLAACDGDPDILDPVDVDLEIDATTAAAIVDEEFRFSDGSFFGTEYAGSEFKLKFKSATTYEASGGGNSEEGTVTYGSCTFTSSTGAVRGPFDPCSVGVNNVGNDFNAVLTLGSLFSEALGAGIDIIETGDGLCEIRWRGILLAQVACDTGS